MSTSTRNYYIELYLCHQESFREKHDLTDLLQIRYNTHHWSEECFDALRQFCTARITRVHSDKDSHATIQRYLGTFKLLRQNGHMSESMGFTLLKSGEDDYKTTGLGGSFWNDGTNRSASVLLPALSCYPAGYRDKKKKKTTTRDVRSHILGYVQLLLCFDTNFVTLLMPVIRILGKKGIIREIQNGVYGKQQT